MYIYIIIIIKVTNLRDRALGQDSNIWVQALLYYE